MLRSNVPPPASPLGVSWETLAEPCRLDDTPKLAEQCGWEAS